MTLNNNSSINNSNSSINKIMDINKGNINNDYYILPRFLAMTALCLGVATISSKAGASPNQQFNNGQSFQQQGIRGKAFQQNSQQQQKNPQLPKSVIHLPNPKKQKGNSNQKIHVKKISIKGNQLLSNKKLNPAIKGLSNKTVTLGQLRNAANQITTIYHHHDYPLAYAYVPAQAIKNGSINISVIEPSYDKVTINNKKARFNKLQAHRILNVYHGQPIKGSSLQRGLVSLNRTPGLRVGGTLVPGAQTGTSSLKVKLHNTRMVKGSVGFDNYGNKYTGRLRTNANVAVNNPFGFGSKVAFNGLVTNHNWLHSYGGTLVSPDLWHGLKVGAYGSSTHYKLGKRFSVLNEHGRASQIGADIKYPILLTPGHILSIRGDFIHDNFGTNIRVRNIKKKSHINMGKLSLSGATRDAIGGSDSGQVSIKYGHLSFDNKLSKVLNERGSDSGGNFWIGQFRFDHDQPLSYHLNLRTSLRGQIASKNLDSSQKIYLGGAHNVMSYPVGDAGGDSGILGKVRLSRSFKVPYHLGIFTPELLAQAGYVRVNHHDYTRSSNNLHRYGIGAGLKYQWNNIISGKVDYVHQVGSRKQTSQPTTHGELWGRIQIMF